MTIGKSGQDMRCGVANTILQVYWPNKKNLTYKLIVYTYVFILHRTHNG